MPPDRPDPAVVGRVLDRFHRYLARPQNARLRDSVQALFLVIPLIVRFTLIEVGHVHDDEPTT